MFTEQLNKVELVGTVGSVAVNKVADKNNIRLSLATEYSYRDSAGSAIVEVTWRNITAVSSMLFSIALYWHCKNDYLCR